MIRTRAELAAQLMKAARGAGLPLALAEDLYCAAPFLTVTDIAAIAAHMAEGGAALSDVTLALDALACGAEADLQEPDLAIAFAAARGVTLTNGQLQPGAPTPSGAPLEIPPTLWQTLDSFAARTYVPDTAASRASGAGAGAIDND